MTQPPVFTTSDYDSEPGKDFDCRVRYEPMVGDVLADGLVKWPMKRSGYWDKPKETEKDKDAA